MARILSWAQQLAIKPIDENNEHKYPQLADEVEQLELRKLIGLQMLIDLQANPATTANAKILNGSTLENGATFKGLRYVIAYLNYSRYLGESSVKDSYTGFKKQKNEESDFLSEGEIKRLQLVNRELALIAFEDIKTFISENINDYPKWDCVNEKKLYTPKIYSIRKTAK